MAGGAILSNNGKGSGVGWAGFTPHEDNSGIEELFKVARRERDACTHMGCVRMAAWLAINPTEIWQGKVEPVSLRCTTWTEWACGLMWCKGHDDVCKDRVPENADGSQHCPSLSHK